MKKALVVITLLFVGSFAEGAFTEFYCDADTTNVRASNLNAGSTQGTTTYFVNNGTWTVATGNFDTQSDPTGLINVGDFASVFLNTVSTGTGFVGRVLSVGTSSITISTITSGFAGIPPVLAGGTANLRVGGVWQGPIATIGFPFGFVSNTFTDASGNFPFVNLKNSANYNVTASIAHANTQGFFSGYSTTVRDGGKATIGVHTTTAFNILTISGGRCLLMDVSVDGTPHTAGGPVAITLSGTGVFGIGLVGRNARGPGISISGNSSGIIESEAYGNNRSNTASSGGIAFSGSPTFAVRSVSHDNSGSNSSGFIGAAGGGQTVFIEECIADTNGQYGFLLRPRAASAILKNSDSYNNVASGVAINSATNGGLTHIENVNLIKNGGYGVEKIDALTDHSITLMNNGFGTGTQANTSGTVETEVGAFGFEVGSINYPTDTTSWIDPANGDFRISLPSAKGAGRGVFTQIQSGYDGTIGYQDIGAAQSTGKKNIGAATVAY